MDRRKVLEGAAATLADMLYSDSHAPQGESVPRILQALIRDDRVPTLYEAECLVYGGPLTAEGEETDGEGNPEVDRNFPYTSRAIMKLVR